MKIEAFLFSIVRLQNESRRKEIGLLVLHNLVHQILIQLIRFRSYYGSD